jgi:uncharacterized Zn-binding protein involved in type VI secretion
MRNYFGYGNTATLTARVNNKDLGYIKVNTVNVLTKTDGVVNPNDWSGKYLIGTTQTITAVSHGFSHFTINGVPVTESTGGVILDGKTLTFVLQGNVTVEAVFGTFNEAISIEVVEIDGKSCIEIRNHNSHAISTKGLYMSCKDDDFFEWQMPAFIIQAGESMLISGNNDISTKVLKRAKVNFDTDSVKMIRLSSADGKTVTCWSRTHECIC